MLPLTYLLYKETHIGNTHHRANDSAEDIKPLLPQPSPSPKLQVAAHLLLRESQTVIALVRSTIEATAP